MQKPSQPRVKKRLLVAAIGVATVSFMGCEVGGVANLVLPPSCEERGDCDAGVDAGVDAGIDQADAGTVDTGIVGGDR